MKLNHLLIILSIILFEIKFSITFIEEYPEPLVYSILSYDDNTIVVHIQFINNEYNVNPELYDCVERNLSFRTIYPNGTVVPIDIPMDKAYIPHVNFCLTKFQGVYLNPLRIYAVKRNRLLATYFDEQYNQWGVLVDLNGNVYSNVSLGPGYPGQVDITTNVDRDKGFLHLSNHESVVTLKQFEITEDNTIIKIADDNLPFNLGPQPIIKSIATIDGNYAIIYTSYIMTPSQNSLSIRGGLYYVYLEHGKGIEREPVVLYQTTQRLRFSYLDCSLAYVRVGQSCILSVIDFTSLTPIETFIRVDFLSKGSVYNISVVTINNQTSELNQDSFTRYSIKPLRFGGYFLCGRIVHSYNISLIGFVLEDSGDYYKWNLSNPTQSNAVGVITILTNNTIVFPQPAGNYTWTLATTDLRKIVGENKYNNPFIDITTPNINVTINGSDIQFLTIKYNDNVFLSDGTITIYQSTNKIMRQRMTINSINTAESGEGEVGKYINPVDDNTISVTIISSTFNKPNETYYVLVSNELVRSRNYDEPVYGLPEGVWYFKTAELDEEIENANIVKKGIRWATDSIDGKVQLTQNGTSYFKGLNGKQKIEFFNNLKREMAEAIPVEEERITTYYRFQTNNLPRIILSINIKKSKNVNGRPVDLIASNLDILIRHKNITALALGSSSQYLDPSYGYERFPRWLEENRNNLIFTAAGLIALTILTIISIYKENKDNLFKRFIVTLPMIGQCFGENKYEINHSAIYETGFTITKFATDILFASIDAEEIEELFACSIVFVTLPFVVNLGFAIKIALDELTKNDTEKKSLREWLRTRKVTLSFNSNTQPEEKKIRLIKLNLNKIAFVIIILLAGADIKTLEILESNLRIYNFKFDVELSKNTPKLISWGTLASLFIGDIPNIVIKSIFLTKAVNTTYLSVLSLLLTAMSGAWTIIEATGIQQTILRRGRQFLGRETAYYL